MTEIAPNLLRVMKSREYREKQSRITKNYFKNKENRRERGLLISKGWTKEKREEWSEKLKERYKNIKIRKKVSKSLKKYFKKHPRSADINKKIDKAVTRWWKEHPNIKKDRARKLKNFFIKHPEDFKKKFMNGKNNPFKPHLKTAFGLVRSLGEKRIADYLAFKKIKAVYEEKVLILEGHPFVPDFWLPYYKVYIEFYGGYPSSWKKKVIKNKLYKKYKIKCIFITPAELGDLDYYLMDELN